MDSFGNEYKNNQLDALETSKMKKTQRIPSGRCKTIKCRLYPSNYNLFYINLVLKKYTKAIMYCSWHYTGHGYKYIRLNGSINPKEFERLSSDFGCISLIFHFDVVGTSKKFIDRLDLSNWFLKKSFPH